MFISAENLYFPTLALLPFSQSLNSASYLQQHPMKLRFQTSFSFPICFYSTGNTYTYIAQDHPPGWSTTLTLLHRARAGKLRYRRAVRKTRCPLYPQRRSTGQPSIRGRIAPSRGRYPHLQLPPPPNPPAPVSSGTQTAPGTDQTPSNKPRYAGNNKLRGGTTPP